MSINEYQSVSKKFTQFIFAAEVPADCKGDLQPLNCGSCGLF